jgi:A/G-specific adenine glycosylase
MSKPKEFPAFRRTVYGYYAKHKRDLLWRRTTDPYKILVSEVMLQQTQVSRVETKYREFLRTFPTIQKLADAPLADVLRAWQGMGYNKRAKMLHEAGKAIVREYRGRFPKDIPTLMTLPGIGPSTAGGICAYAYDMPVVFIETNIRRVYIHHFFGDREGVSDTDIRPIVEATLDMKHPRQWYSALMDYGTHLATTVPNPNRRSKHYAKQKTFKGSDREIRGAILKALLEKPLTRTILLKRFAHDRNRTLRILNTLEYEGLITRTRNTYEIGS